jgi:hypothetical protein
MIKDSVLSIVTELIEKKKGKIEPEIITFSELIQSIKGSLNELYKEGKIKVGDTINDKYIEVI